MVDYNAALPQLTPYQAPNVLGMAEMANKLQLYNTMRQEKERGFAESNALRDWIKNGGDVTTPEGQRAAVALAPNAGPGFIKANLDIIGQDRANKQAALGLTETQGRINAQGPALQTSQTEAAAKILAFHRETAPIVKDQATYDIWRANLLKDAPKLASEVDPVYSPEGMQRLIMTHDASTKEYAAQAAEQRLRERPGIQTIENPDGSKTIVRVAPGGGAATPVQGGTSAAKPPAVWQDPNSGRSYQPVINANGEVTGQREVTPGNVAPPAARGAAATNPAAIDAQIMGSEGLGRNPLSTAQGPGQIVDRTFVSAFKQMYPTQAQGMSDDAILARRSPELQTQMVSYLRNQNVAALPQGVTPDAGNLKLMHFLGQPDALKVFKADPNTPVEQLVSPAAIAANSSILAGKTAGQVIQWARANMNAQGGVTPAMTGGGATPTQTPGGVTNNLAPALAPGAGNALPDVLAGMQPAPQTPLSLNPTIASNLSPKAAAQQEVELAKLAVTPRPGFEKVPGGEKFIKGGPEDPEVKAAAKTAEETGKAAGQQKAQEMARKESASRLMKMVGGENESKIVDLINASTSGDLERAGAYLVGATTGTATPGRVNIGTLDVTTKQIVMDLLNGHLGAGISEGDRKFIEGMAASLSDAGMAANERVARLKQFNATMKAWANGEKLDIPTPAFEEARSVERGANGRRGTLGVTPAATPSRPPLSYFGGG
jgi:hypothetical protein